MFDDPYLRALKIERWRDLKLAQKEGAEAKTLREGALERLVRNQTLISAIEAVRSEPAPSKDDLQGTGIDGNPLDPEDTVSLPSLRLVGQGLLCLMFAVTAFMLSKASRYIGFMAYTLKAPMGGRHEGDLEP